MPDHRDIDVSILREVDALTPGSPPLRTVWHGRHGERGDRSTKGPMTDDELQRAAMRAATTLGPWRRRVLREAGPVRAERTRRRANAAQAAARARAKAEREAAELREAQAREERRQAKRRATLERQKASGRPPSPRRCSLCGRVGHYAKRCPQMLGGA